MHRFRFLLFCVLIISNFTNASEKIIKKDKFIFKISNEVYNVQDIINYNSYLEFMHCIEPSQFLINSVYLPWFKTTLSKLTSYKNEKAFTPEEKKYYIKIIPFFKMLIYKNTYDLVIKDDLISAMEMQAKKHSCYKHLDKNIEFKLSKNDIFLNLMKLELFLRSRFWNSARVSETRKEDLKKASASVLELTKSVSKQIVHLLYWETSDDNIK